MTSILQFIKILKYHRFDFKFLRHRRCFKSWSTVAYAFNQKPNKISSLKSDFFAERTGIFGKSELQEPTGFYLVKENAIAKAECLIHEIKSPTRKRKMVRIFDELSDVLCKVADLAEFVRIAHPQERFSYAAKEASISISSYVEELNTNRVLYERLKYVLEKGDICATENIDDFVARLFLFDFEQNGILHDEKTREKIVAFNDYILHVGSNFMSRTLAPRTVLKSQLPQSVQQCLPETGEAVSMGELFSDSKSEAIREASYKIFLHPEKHQEELLDELLNARQQLAKLCGFPSFAHRALLGSLAGSPEFVQEFLKLLSSKIKPIAEEDYKILFNFKKELKDNVQSLMPWDVPYLISTFKQKTHSLKTEDYTPYFSIGACMDGLNYVVNSLYNLTFNIETPKNGELWHDDVRKLSVMSGSEVIGFIYCDLFLRADKPNQDCHFTIQGGRLCDDGTYQKPIVALMLNLPNGTWAHPPLLASCMVDNLFHEFGHAMHSMLARADYQHVTGTRCAVDLAEVPSIFMEYFASDPRVVAQFARHFQTGETISDEMVNKLFYSRKMFSACEMQLQIFYAAFDQICHKEKLKPGTTTDLLAQVQNTYYGLPYVSNTAWQLRFGHLNGYGAKYYSYLVSRAIASWIWHSYFKENPCNQEEGHRYQNEFLAFGGSKPPRQLVEDFIGTKVTPECLSDALLHDIS